MVPSAGRQMLSRSCFEASGYGFSVVHRLLVAIKIGMARSDEHQNWSHLMSNIQPYTPSAGSGSSSLSPWSSQGRALSRIVSGAELEVATLAAAAHVETAKLDAIDHITQRAMQGTAMVAQIESQLAEAVPAAAFRLAQIGQAHTLNMVGAVHSFGRGLR